MAKYKVIQNFRDLEDENHVYSVNDKFPRKGRTKKARVEELLSSDNALGKPVIEEIVEEESKKKEPKKEDEQKDSKEESQEETEDK